MGRVEEILSESPIIASVSTLEDFQQACGCEQVSCVMLKFGDIDTIATLIDTAHRHKKRVIVHLDSIKGVAKDVCGVKFLAKAGADCLNTTKPQLIGAIREVGMVAIQVMFLVDTEALKTGIESINKNKPDAVVIMPSSIPGEIVKEMIKRTKVKLIAGGLLTKKEEIAQALEKGIASVVTSRRELWDHGFSKGKAASGKLRIL